MSLKVPRARLIRAVRRSFLVALLSIVVFLLARISPSPSLSTRSRSMVEEARGKKRHESLSLFLFQIQPVITWSTRNGGIIAFDPLFARGFCSLNLYSYRFFVCSFFLPPSPSPLAFLVLSSPSVISCFTSNLSRPTFLFTGARRVVVHGIRRVHGTTAGS